MKFRSFCQIAILLFVATAVQASPRVALMDFSTDDNSYRSAQKAADFTTLLQVHLLGEEGLEWVERAQLGRVKQELKISAVENIGGASSIRLGKLAKADWLITGQFSLDDKNQRTLSLEITDLQHADVLASSTMTFPGAATSQFEFATNQIEDAAGVLRRLLAEAHLRQQQMADKILVAPLFLAEVSGNGGGFGFSKGNGELEQNFLEMLERAATTNDHVRLIRFPKAYRSTEESELVLDGLVEANQKAWQQAADLYIWGTYAVKRKTTPGQRPDEKLEIDLHLWDGVSQPTVIQEAMPYSFNNGVRPGDIAATLNRLAGEVIARAHKNTNQADAAAFRQDISKSLVDTYDQMTLSYHHREELGLHQPEKFLQAVHILETACFFDPDNAKARVLYITCRWGWWMDFGFNTKNGFWSKWRRSEALRKYVERFGLQPVTVELPFPYNMNGGIQALYVNSLGEVLGMFPQWHSEEEMALEDKWQKEGVHTWLIEAELHGFPKEMPRALAMKWKIETEAELALRKKRVEEYKMSNPAATNSVLAATFPPMQKNPATTVAQKTREVPSARPAASQMVPTPAWAKDIHTFYSMFRLFPPNALPLEVKPNMDEIRFPKQFEVQTIDRLDFLDDQLLILAMDERSAPSSDNNSDVSAELLDKHHRLWVLKPDDENPTLYEAGQFPQSISDFLIKDKKLWVAGKITGYLDLAKKTFRKFGLADGFDQQASEALGFAGGQVFAAGDNFNVSRFDAAQDHWSHLVLPPANLSGGTGSPFLLAGSKQWVVYVAGSVLIYDFTHNTWTNLANMDSVQHILADDSGFWFGGRDGLHFYDPASKSSKHWSAPSIFNGLFLSMMGSSFAGNSEIRRQDLEKMDEQIQGLMKKLQGDRVKNHSGKREGNPLHLDWRMPGEVTALAKDGDFLWVGIGNYFGNHLLLLHQPSGSVVAGCPMPVRDAISSLAVSKTSVWAGTAYGDHKLFQIPKDVFTSVPQSRWVSLAISPDERTRLVSGMSVRDQAMHAFYAADDARVAALFGEVDSDKASLEQMFLLAFSYDTLGLDKPGLARTWFEKIMSRYPDSGWAKFAQDALAKNEQNHKIKAHQEKLLAKYDANHDGVLGAEEKSMMEKDAGYQQEKSAWEGDQLDIQFKEIMQGFDSNGDGKLDRDELERLKTRVNAFSQAPPEMLKGHKILVAPLIGKTFPEISAVLKKYDSNQDGGLEIEELKIFAKEIQKGR
jgi:Ca2+-binding EF-hand superfamily protein